MKEKSVILCFCVVFHLLSYFVSASCESSGPEVMKKKICSTQLSLEFIKLINVKMPTVVGILTIISLINTASESLKVKNNLEFSAV